MVAVLSAAVYATSLAVPFIEWDDPLYVTRNPRIQGPGFDGLATVWSPEAAWTGRFIEYFPIRDTAYWLNYQLSGLNPLPYHLTSIAFHVASTLLLFALARQLRFSREVSFWGALLFGLHPIHVESVAWVSGLKDPMFTAFAFLSLLFYGRYLTRRDRGTTRSRCSRWSRRCSARAWQ